jgi:hypothetical protein
LVCAFETMLTRDYDQQIPHVDQSLFESQVPICLWGPYFYAGIDVGCQELPGPGIESVTEPLKKKGRRPQSAVRIAWQTCLLVLGSRQ